MKSYEINETKLKELVNKLYEVGEEMFNYPEEFAVVLAMASKYISDANGIEVHAERRTDS